MVATSAYFEIGDLWIFLDIFGYFVSFCFEMWQSSLLAVFAGCLGGETAGCSAGGPDCIRPARNVLRLPLPLPLAPGPQRCPRPLGANSGREHNKNLSRTKSIPSGYVNIAIENGDRNSGFTH